MDYQTNLIWTLLMIFLFPFHLTPILLISGHQIELISPISIYPCLDTYDILVNRQKFLLSTNLSSSSSPSNQVIELIRVYTTDDPSRHLRQYYYLKEFRVPHNKLVKLRCSFFTPEAKYYCFSYVAMFKTNLSIALWTQPECKTTISESDLNSQYSSPIPNNGLTSIELSGNPDSDLTSADGILSPHGPSYSVHSTDEAAKEFGKNDLSRTPVKMIKCRCNHLINYSENSSATNNLARSHFLLEIFPCSSMSDPLCSNSLNPRLSQPATSDKTDLEPLCLVNLTQPGIGLKVQVVRSLYCDKSIVSQHRSDHRGLPVLRDGLFSIDPQLEVTNESITYHQLRTSFLRVESPVDRYFLVSVTIIQASGHLELLDKLFLFFTSIQLTWLSLIGLISFILLSIILFTCFWCIVPFSRRQVKAQQALLLDDLAATSTSFVDVSSLEQFSFDESGSLEMDYYDYEMHLAKGSLDKLSSCDTVSDNNAIE